MTFSETQDLPCQPWCAVEHAADEFRNAGALLCRRSLVAASRLVVEVHQATAADEVDEQDSFVILPATIWSRVDWNEWAAQPDDAEIYAVALLEAVKFIRTRTADGQLVHESKDLRSRLGSEERH